MAVKNSALIYTKVPTELPVPGEHLQTQEIGTFDKNQAPPLGGVTLEHLYVSFDPYLRGLLRDPSVKSYTPALPLNTPMRAGTVARVLSSDHANYAKGDLIVHLLPVQQFSTLTADEINKSPVGPPRKVSAEHAGGDPRHFLGALGMPGLTAYASFYEIGKPKRGETIVVSSAAGAVGQIVGQLAKHEGLKVYGSVGSDDKLDFIINELGFDGGWNYKKEKSTKDVINRLTDGKGIDIFYDNVGGEQLDGALETLHDFGRIVACGQISQYNLKPENRYPLTNTINVVSRRLLWQGFIVSDANMAPKHGAAHQQNVSQWLKDGSFKAKIHETVGIENAAQAFVGMLRGENFGKAVLKVGDF